MEDVRLEGKTVIVTGSNTGIGKETARELARRGARVILACRDKSRAEAARDEIVQDTGNDHVVVKELNLASLRSVKEFADDINKNEPRVDILVNNAGVFSQSRKKTDDGIDLVFGVNHLGHFYLTTLLLDKLKASIPSRIVIVASDAYRFGKLDFDDIQTKRRYSGFKAYARSKTANVLFGVFLANMLQDSGVTVYSLHPGVVKTEIARDMSPFFKCMAACCVKMSGGKELTSREGAMTSLYCCLEPSIAQDSGKYYSDCKETEAKKHATDEMIAERLWQASQELFIIAQSS